MALLEKVEELTLYTLQQQEALDRKQQQLANQEQRIAKLEAMMMQINH